MELVNAVYGVKELEAEVGRWVQWITMSITYQSVNININKRIKT